MHVQLFYFYELLINFDKSEKGREGGGPLLGSYCYLRGIQVFLLL